MRHFTYEIEKGQFIITVGTGGEDFIAKKIKIANKEDMPVVNRGIDFKFKEFDNNNPRLISPELLYFNEVEKECIGQCFKLNNGPNCFKECHK